MSKEEKIVGQCKSSVSKELEALHTIAFNTQFIAGMNFGNELRTIEKALQRLEAIDNAKPSEALKCWRYLNAVVPEWARKPDNGTDALEIIKQALLKAQEQEKVIEVVFKKQVDLSWLWYCIHEYVNSLNEYNKKMPIEKFKLTEEEFDTLKRWADGR